MKNIGTKSINMSDIMILWPCLVQLFIKSYVLGGLKDKLFFDFCTFPLLKLGTQSKVSPLLVGKASLSDIMKNQKTLHGINTSRFLENYQLLEPYPYRSRKVKAGYFSPTNLMIR